MRLLILFKVSMYPKHFVLFYLRPQLWVWLWLPLSNTKTRGYKTYPKKEENWRPITLLNTDYKIAAKSIANRIKLVLPNLINHDQTGFLKDRFIGENIRLINCIIQYATEKNVPGLLLFIDFEKAFDSVAWSFILIH